MRESGKTRDGGLVVRFPVNIPLTLAHHDVHRCMYIKARFKLLMARSTYIISAQILLAEHFIALVTRNIIITSLEQ